MFVHKLNKPAKILVMSYETYKMGYFKGLTLCFLEIINFFYLSKLITDFIPVIVHIKPDFSPMKL
jgi:hypothetical protein